MVIRPDLVIGDAVSCAASGGGQTLHEALRQFAIDGFERPAGPFVSVHGPVGGMRRLGERRSRGGAAEVAGEVARFALRPDDKPTDWRGDEPAMRVRR